MHIDTNAQNCNFLSVFVSLRGSLSCQWIVRCVVLSLPLYHSLFLFSNILMSEGVQNKDFLLTAGKWKRLFQNCRGKKMWTIIRHWVRKREFYFNFGLRLSCALTRVYVYLIYPFCTDFLLIVQGCKCDPIVYKQVSSHTANTQECQETSQPFSINPRKHVVSPLSISGSWLNSTCQMTLKCHNHWDVFLRLRRPGSRGRREDDGRVIASLSSHRPWLAHARPDYRSWCWWRVTLRLPAVCYQEPLDP